MKRRLAEVISSFGLENLVMRDTMTLSGGEKQLLNIASGLATVSYTHLTLPTTSLV